jgi:hypothetical protein
MSRTREEYDNLIKLFDTIKELKAEKAELIKFIRNIEETNLDDLLDIEIPKILKKYKEEI